jgi:hypothetical protein
MMTPPINDGYPLVNSLVDPENNQFLVGTSLPTLSAKVQVVAV